jgi:ABC-type transport system substrate-binding protein
MRRMFRRPLCAFAVVAAVAGALFAGASPAANGATGATGQTFRVGLVGDAPSLDVARDTSALAKEVWTLQYPRLTDYAENDLSPVPGLADAWTPSADGRRFTYRLREGLTWSDGSPVTPADVVSSIDRARDEGWPGTEGALDDVTARASGPREVVVESARLDRRLPIVPRPGGAAARRRAGRGLGPVRGRASRRQCGAHGRQRALLARPAGFRRARVRGVRRR